MAVRQEERGECEALVWEGGQREEALYVRVSVCLCGCVCVCVVVRDAERGAVLTSRVVWKQADDGELEHDTAARYPSTLPCCRYVRYHLPYLCVCWALFGASLPNSTRQCPAAYNLRCSAVHVRGQVRR